MKIKFSAFWMICGVLFFCLPLTGCDFLFGDDNNNHEDDDVVVDGDGGLDESLGGSFAGGNPSFFNQNVDHSVGSSVDTGRTFLSATAGLETSVVMTYVSDDGSVSVCSATNTATYVYEYSAGLQHIKTMLFQNDFSMFGAFAKDNQGNYYFFYAKDVEENQKNVENMSLVKYDSSGKRVNTYRLTAFPDSSAQGIRDPFHAGACRMEISGNMVAVYFARRMFQSPNDGLNHQASYGFVINKDTFARVDKGAGGSTSQGNTQMPYVSHSFNQFILPVNNGFMFADHGDYYPRCFAFARFQEGQATKKLNAFLLKGGNEGEQHYNYTFAQLGGLAETSSGYIFAGTYEKNNIASSAHNDSRNLFVLTLDNGLNNISEPIWITNYSDKNNENAASPKIVALNNDRYLLMWELMGNIGYKLTYMAIIDKTGGLLSSVKELTSVRLNINDVLRYNRTNGNVYWAVDNDDKNIDVFSFNPDNTINVPVRPGAPGGGHGLALENFTVDKIRVSQYELFTVQASIRNRGLDVFPGGQIGAALVNSNGDIVEVVGILNFDALNAGSLRSNRTVNCAVPDTVSAGSYRLRIVVRPAGGEWRVATMTSNGVPNAIPVTVTTGVANSGGYGLALTQFTVNDDKVSVPQGERFGVVVRAMKIGTEAFPGGQIGVAFVANNSTIVEVINTRDWAALEPGSTRSQSMSSITVPKTVALGNYNLRVVARPTDGEWRIVTMAVDGVPNSINFTVR